MPSISQLSFPSTSFAVILNKIVTALSGLTGPDGNKVPVNAIARPTDQIPIYQAQNAILFHVSEPHPFDRHGAGRYGRRAIRYITIILITQSLKDQAGSDIQAMIDHVLLEEIVVNAIDLLGPIGLQTDWVDGAGDMVRQLKSDPGLLLSGLRMRTEYVQSEVVRIGTTP